MIFSSDQIEKLRVKVKHKLSEKRYIHTLGVENMSVIIGEFLLPDSISELRVAALLHDIAKEMSYEDQMRLISDSGNYTNEDLAVKPTLHSFAAVPIIQNYFSDYATENVLSAVHNHTLGSEDMSVFDEIIFISDYTEEGRTYHECLTARRYLLNNLSKDKTYEDNLLILHQASLLALKSTIDSLTRRSEAINNRTIKTKEYLENILKKNFIS